MRRPCLLLPVLLAGCVGAAPEAEAPAAPALAMALPAGITEADLYTRRPDPTGPVCSYYRVEGFEVLAGCAG